MGGDRYVYGLDSGDGFIGVHLSTLQSHLDVYTKYVQLFLY